MRISVRLRRIAPRVVSSASILLLGAALNALAASGLRVVVVEGEGAINNIRAHTAHDPIVEVHDDTDAVVPQATVTFQAPAAGASVAFSDGQKTFIAQTDNAGRAAAHGLHPNTVTGSYELLVTASFRSETASAVITQTNASPFEAKSSKKFWLVGLAAGAAAGGALAISHGSKSATASQTTSSGAIVPGSPSFGPPH
jgi:hypothetical protein